MKIIDIIESTRPIKSDIRNAYIDFSKMTLSLVAVVTDVVRDGKPVIGYGFNSNGRYGQGQLIRERFRPRVLEAKVGALLNEAGDNLDPHKIWDCMMSNEKPGGHGERSVAVGTLDMAIWTPPPRLPDCRCTTCWRSATAMARPTRRCLSMRPVATTIPAKAFRACWARCRATWTGATAW